MTSSRNWAQNHYVCSRCYHQRPFNQELMDSAVRKHEEKIAKYVKFWIPIVKKKMRSSAQQGNFTCVIKFVCFFIFGVTPTMKEFPEFINRLMVDEDLQTVEYKIEANKVTFTWNVEAPLSEEERNQRRWEIYHNTMY